MPSKKEEIEQYWLEHYENWKTSGQKQKDYCFSHGLSIHILRAHITRIRKKPKKRKKSRFLPIPTEKLFSNRKQPIQVHTPQLSLRYKSDFSIDIPTDFSQKTLFEIIKVMETV